MAYRLLITGAARKDLDQLPKEVLERADPKLALHDELLYDELSRVANILSRNGIACTDS